jgi:hypothetical protein
MKLLNSPRKLFWAGLVCVLLGFILPFLIVLKFIENTFALSFFIYTLQLVGMILGIMAAAGLAIDKRVKKKMKEEAQKKEANETESEIGWMK